MPLLSVKDAEIIRDFILCSNAWICDTYMYSFVIGNWPTSEGKKLVFALKFIDQCSVVCMQLDYSEKQWRCFHVDKQTYQLINFDNTQ